MVDGHRAQLLFTDVRGEGKEEAFRIVERARRSGAVLPSASSSPSPALPPPPLPPPLPRVSCFPGLHECVRKAELGRSLSLFHRLFPSDFDFVPDTFDLQQTSGLALAREQLSHGRVLIVKPSRGSQGSGIHLVQHFDALQRLLRRHPRRAFIAQRYVDSPLLLDGYKMDVRVYVLLHSLHPLQLTLFRDGLVRLCTEAYETPSPSNLHRSYMHLSNYAINKGNSQHFRPATEDADAAPHQAPSSARGRLEDSSSKRSIGAALAQLSYQGSPVDANRFWSDVSDVVEKTIIALQPALYERYSATFPSTATVNAVAHPPPSASFHLLGFDLLLDSALKVWLLEVNAAPSMNTDSALDMRIKASILDTCIHTLTHHAHTQPTHHAPSQHHMHMQTPLYDHCSSRIGAPPPPPLSPCSNGVALTSRSTASTGSTTSRRSNCTNRSPHRARGTPTASPHSMSTPRPSSSASSPCRRSPSPRLFAASLRRSVSRIPCSSSSSAASNRPHSPALGQPPRWDGLTSAEHRSVPFTCLQPSVSSSFPHLLLFTHQTLLSLFASFTSAASGGAGGGG